MVYSCWRMVFFIDKFYHSRAYWFILWFHSWLNTRELLCGRCGLLPLIRGNVWDGCSFGLRSEEYFFCNKPVIYWKKNIFIVVALALPFSPLLKQTIQIAIDPSIFKYSRFIDQIAFNTDGTLSTLAREVILRDIISCVGKLPWS